MYIHICTHLEFTHFCSINKHLKLGIHNNCGKYLRFHLLIMLFGLPLVTTVVVFPLIYNLLSGNTWLLVRVFVVYTA